MTASHAPRMAWRGRPAHGAAAPSFPRRGQALEDGDAEGHSLPAAASRSCAAFLTWPRAPVTADTELTPGLALRLPTAVWSVASAALSALVCSCHRPCASVTSFVRAALTFWRSEVISSAMPACTVTWVSWFSEARRAAMSAHRTELDGEAAAAGEEDDGAAEDVPPGEVLLEAHPASSARPHAVTTSFHRAPWVAVPE